MNNKYVTFYLEEEITDWYFDMIYHLLIDSLAIDETNADIYMEILLDYIDNHKHMLARDVYDLWTNPDLTYDIYEKFFLDKKNKM